MSAEIGIRPLRRDEVDAFRGVAVRSWRDAYAGLLPQAAIDDAPVMIGRAIEKRFDAFVVACLADRLAGYYSLGEGNYLWHLYVDPPVQRRGVGRALHDAAMAEIAARGFSSATLDVAAANEKALRFYRSLGWRETGRETADGLELILMERETRRDA